MILVTVGTHDHGFNRLVQPMDELAADLNETVVIQRGSSTYEPQHAGHFQLTTSEHMAQLTEAAAVIVTHAAAGAVILAMQKGKPLVVVPRRQQFGEHLDDHQLQLAKALEKQGKAAIVYEPSPLTLLEALVKVVGANNYHPQGAAQLKSQLRQLVTGDSPTHQEL
ncbi:MAG TPA: glycosyltransferase [Chloroflexota bacterium]|nr:glycosyltransferase [Chloroflexota bacterium]HUM67375.1 glycosyltransferase [Chloroflexota bacterium]